MARRLNWIAACGSVRSMPAPARGLRSHCAQAMRGGTRLRVEGGEQLQPVGGGRSDTPRSMLGASRWPAAAGEGVIGS